MRDLVITLIQSELYWEDVEANLASFEEQIWTTDNTDLIILPEMFNTGFTMNTAGNSELINGRTFKWMRQMAKQKKAVIIGSLIISENQQFYNRLIWMKPDGNFSFYDKRHLFTMAGEDHYFQPGETLLVESLNGWKISPFICYDLRFPEWLRNRYNKNTGRPAYDVAILIANWPSTRIYAWDILLKSRAIENASYMVGVNRVGTDGEGIDYNGHSKVLGPKGDTLVDMGEKSKVISLSLSYSNLDSYRKKFPVLQDSDDFIVN